jgi:hypothetical protein
LVKVAVQIIMTRQESKATLLNFFILPVILFVSIGLAVLQTNYYETLPVETSRTDDLGGGGAGVLIFAILVSSLFFLPSFIWWNLRVIRTISKFGAGKITKRLNIAILILPYAALAVTFIPPFISGQLKTSGVRAKTKAQTVETRLVELSPASAEYVNISSVGSLQEASPFLETRFDPDSNTLSVMNSFSNPNEHFGKLYGYITGGLTMQYYHFDLADSIYFRVVFPSGQATGSNDFQKYLHIASFSGNSYVYKISLSDHQLDLDSLFGFSPLLFSYSGNFYIIWKKRIFKFPLKK